MFDRPSAFAAGDEPRCKSVTPSTVAGEHCSQSYLRMIDNYYLVTVDMRSVIHARDTGGRAETAGRAGVIREYPHLMEHYPRPDGISSPLPYG